MVELQPFSFDRMIRAVEKVRERLLKAAGALERAGIPYAVVGGNAVAAWVSRVDEAAVRNTQDVDILLRRADLERAKAALQAVGFVYRHVKSIDMFLDGPDAKARDAVHIIFAGEKVKADAPAASPDVTQAERMHDYFAIALQPLVQMKLTAFRLKDQVHLLDLLEVGLIDKSWPEKFPPALASRLQAIVDNPEGLAG